MVKTINEINTKDWQISKKGVGQIAENIDDIRQSLEFIIFTAKGSLPLDPNFGTNVHLYVDQPVNIVTPKLTSEIVNGVNNYEERIEIESITSYYQYERLFIKIVAKMIINKNLVEFIYDLDNYLTGKDTSDLVRSYSDAYSNAYA